jgi:hypothetical protein
MKASLLHALILSSGFLNQKVSGVSPPPQTHPTQTDFVRLQKAEEKHQRKLKRNQEWKV